MSWSEVSYSAVISSESCSLLSSSLRNWEVWWSLEEGVLALFLLPPPPPRFFLFPIDWLIEKASIKTITVSKQRVDEWRTMAVTRYWREIGEKSSLHQQHSAPCYRQRKEGKMLVFCIILFFFFGTGVFFFTFAPLSDPSMVGN